MYTVYTCNILDHQQSKGYTQSSENAVEEWESMKQLNQSDHCSCNQGNVK